MKSLASRVSAIFDARALVSPPTPSRLDTGDRRNTLQRRPRVRVDEDVEAEPPHGCVRQRDHLAESLLINIRTTRSNSLAASRRMNTLSSCKCRRCPDSVAVNARRSRIP